MLMDWRNYINKKQLKSVESLSDEMAFDRLDTWGCPADMRSYSYLRSFG